jgi:hypothetical protein
MRLRIARPAFSALASRAILPFARTAATQKANAPQSFYIVTHVFSDDLPSGDQEILQVTHHEQDVCVRLIRISVANPYCADACILRTTIYLRIPCLQSRRGSSARCAWQFSSSAQSEQPVAANLKFTLCPGEN